MSSRPETEWDETEREWMLALQRYRDTEQCPRCGGPKWQCQDAAAESQWEATPPTRCHISTVVGIAQKRYLDQPHADQEQALMWGVKRRIPTPEPQ